MTFNHLTIGKRIGLMAGFILILLLASGSTSFLGVGQIVENATEVISGNQLDGLLAQKEVDHLNWVRGVNRLFSDTAITQLEVETDDHKCGLGQWLYGPQRLQAELLLPDLKPLLETLETPHHALHASAVAIDDRYEAADASLGNFLRDKKIDHLNWINRLKDTILDPASTALTIETDPTRCSLGQWIHADETARLGQADPDFGSVYQTIIEPHKNLHASAVAIQKLISANKHNTALTYYAEHTRSFASETLAAIDGALKWHAARMTGIEQAQAIYSDQTLPALAKVQTLLGKIRHTARQHIMTDTVMLQAARSTRLRVLIISVAALCLGLGLAFLVTRGIVNAIRKVSGSIEESALQVNAAAVQVSSASQTLSDGSANQAGSIEETSASVKQINDQGHETSRLTQGAAEMMNKNIMRSGQSLKSLVDLTRKMNQIEADSDQIGQIIKTIDEIAFQTNLLALNAAVEAARAGEAGAGFAVVADEVRNLALRAAEAAKNTQELLDGTLNRVSQATADIKTINEDFEEIIESATLMGEKTEAITVASREQAEALDQVNTAVDQIEQVTQEVASSAEESAAASEELSGQAEEMQGIVGDLARMVGRQKHARKRSGEPTRELDCWNAKNCPSDRRDGCPAYPDHGSRCWLVTGTLCGGQTQGSYRQKMAKCEQCDHYQTVNSSVSQTLVAETSTAAPSKLLTQQED